MNIRPLLAFLPHLAVVGIAALVGFSVTRVDSGAAEHQIGFTLGAAVIATIAIRITRIHSSDSATHQSSAIPPRKLTGLKVGFVGFCIALLGWLVGVLVNHMTGFLLVAIGILIGFVGMAIHFILMFGPNE